MRYGKLSLKNYGSYKELEFNYNNLGLCLVSGPTKAGKSTVMDAAGWVLFGQTSKDLNADDVRSWFAEDETSGVLEVYLWDRTIYVTRIRGKRLSQNDFYFQVERTDEAGISEPLRGKDANDTQKLLNEELGITPELYFAASYMHQFTGDRFFTAKAKERRESMEKIADMDLAIKLGAAASEQRKGAKRDLEAAQQGAARLQGKSEMLSTALCEHRHAKARWTEQRASDRATLEDLGARFEDDKEKRVFDLVDQLEGLDKMIQQPEHYSSRAFALRAQLKSIEPLDKELKERTKELSTAEAEYASANREYSKYSELKGNCPTCLGPSNNPHKEKHLAEVLARVNKLKHETTELDIEVERLQNAVAVKPKLQDNLQKVGVEEAENRRLIDKFESIRAMAVSLREQINPYTEQLETYDNEVNPYIEQEKNTKQKLSLITEEIEHVDQEIANLEGRYSALTWLYERSYKLRGLFLERAVKQINKGTNEVLEKYFDAALRVDFALVDSDKLEVSISNEGYDCKYPQLSGGERCMLKLAFSIAYMRAAENTAGVKFKTIMLDETMNGLDADLKVKAFALLQDLEKSYESILLIDHAEEFKQLFSNKFVVTKTGAYSSIQSDSI